MTTYTETAESIDNKLTQLLAAITDRNTSIDQQFETLIANIKEHDSLFGHVAAHVGEDEEAQQQLDGLAGENHELKRLVTLINRALDTDDIDNAVELIAQGVRRSRALEADFGRLWQKIQEHDSRLNDHDTRLDDLSSRIARVEELIQNGYGTDLAASMAGFDTDELLQILRLDPDNNADLTEVDVLRAVTDWMRRTERAVVEAHQRLTAVERNVNERFTGVQTQVDRIETSVTEIRETSQSNTSSGSVGVAFGVGLLAFILALWFINSRSDDPFWVRFGASFGFAAIIAGAILAVTAAIGSSQYTTSRSETREGTSEQPARRSWRRPPADANEQQSTSTDQVRARAGSDNPSGSSASGDRTNPEPAPARS